MGDFDPSNDPNIETERQNYDNPIVSRDYILTCLEQLKAPASMEVLVRAFGYKTDEQQELLRRRLRAMERDAQILRDRKNRYALIDQLNLKKGRIQAHRDGYGFVVLEGQDDWYVHPRQMKKVFHGDEVLARPDGRAFKGRTEAFIVRVLSEKDIRLVGRFHREGNTGFVIPEDSRFPDYIHIPPEGALQPNEGQVVVVDVVKRPTDRFMAVGEIIEVLGEHLDPGLEIEVAIRGHNIPHQWPEDVLQEAGTLSESVRAEDISGRIDLREMPLVTIDGIDAKDFDDAVYCESNNDGGWQLWVAIADVSHYVRPNSALDAEALNRGNSVYFPGQVVPMLPEVLSNGLCSLNPDVDRLCMVSEMSISVQGELQKTKFYPAVMRSKARLIYDDVGKLFEGDVAIRKQLGSLVNPLFRLHDLYKVLSKRREKRGAISFETTETYIEFDQNRKIDKILPLIRNDAHKLIEECMILANVASAEFFEKHKIPGLYRIHDGPSMKGLETLREYLASLGLWLGGDDKPTPNDYQALLDQCKDHPSAEQIQTMLLRSLSQAKYDPENVGHFGLSLPLYTHFTSPIRRYPDLIVHRVIKHYLSNKQQDLVGSESGHGYSEQELLQVGEHCSMTERRADDASREVVSWLKCEYMLEHIGARFEGRVSSVAAFGVFVTLNDIHIEGLIHVTDLPGDYYHFDAVHLSLAGEKTGEIFQLGDRILIEVAQVNLEDRKIDFSCIEHDMQGRKAPRVSAKPRQKTGKTAKAIKKKRASNKSKRANKSRSKPQSNTSNKNNKSKRGRKSR